MAEFRDPFDSPAFFEQALFLYTKYLKYLEDDYALNGLTVYDYFYNLVQRTAPFFFVMKYPENAPGPFCGRGKGWKHWKFLISWKSSKVHWIFFFT